MHVLTFRFVMHVFQACVDCIFPGASAAQVMHVEPLHLYTDFTSRSRSKNSSCASMGKLSCRMVEVLQGGHPV